MALNAYLKLKGQKQGEIKGSVKQKGREKKIEVISASHEISSPRDASTGLGSGKRVHKPFIITKEIDQSSPLLYQALITNELITEFELQFWTTQVPGRLGIGNERQHYTVKLTNAVISDIKFTMPNNRIPELTPLLENEEISFIYEKIEWIWTEGGIIATDTKP